MEEKHLYVYIPRPHTVQKHGVCAPSNISFDRVKHYVKRTAEYYHIDETEVDHKKIMQYLETWFRGRSRAISVLTEPIPDTASERILEFRNMSDCVTLPSFEELKKHNIAEACYLSVDGGKDKKVNGPDYTPINWKQDKTPQYRFKGIRHYFIVLKSGVVPAKYCTIGNDFVEESLSESTDIREIIWERAKKYYPTKASHGLNHIINNLDNAKRMVEFAKEKLTDQAYAAIVFHDSGIEKYGRDKHEIYGAEIAKRELKDLFDSKDLFLICAAIKEHRASFKGKFTSMLSDLCSSADRNVPDFEKAVARSFLYASEHHPEFSFDEKCLAVASHLKEKYGSEGYARFPSYYTHYYAAALKVFKRKIDALTGDIVKNVVGSRGEKASKIYDVAVESYQEIVDGKKLEMVAVSNNPSEKELEVILKCTNESAKASGDEQWTMQDLKDKFKSKNAKLRHCVIFYLDKQPIAAAMYMNPDSKVRAFCIGDFALYPEYRGKGLGSKCFKMLLDKIKSIDKTLPIYLGVEVNNTKAIELYKKFGFKITKTNDENGHKYHLMFLGKSIDFDATTNKDSDKIKRISFPSEEHAALKKQDKIVTTRVSADYDKFFVGDLVETPWKALFKVVKRQEITNIKQHPFYSELTESQIKFLSKYNKIAVLTLEKVESAEESYSETATEISGDYNQWFGEYMYHGSSSKFTTLEPQLRNNRTTSTTKPKIFFTPFKGFAGIFCIDQNDQLLSVFGDRYDKGTIKVIPKELPTKDRDGNYDLSQFQQVNTNIAFKHNVREFKTKFTKRFVGYIHFVNTEKLISSGLQEHVFSGIPEYWYYKPIHVDKVEKVEIVATFEYDQTFANKVGRAIVFPEIATESLSDKVTSNIENDKVYHASPLKLDVLRGKASRTKDAKTSVFVSPFKHFASMFILDFQGIVDTIEEQIGKKHIQIDNFGFMEWDETPRSTTSIPSKIHVLVRTPENFKPFKGKATGYMYTIDFNKYKDKADMWSHAKDSDVELIIHGDVRYEKCEQISYEYEVMKDTKQYNHAVEVLTQENFEFPEDLSVAVGLRQEFDAGIEEFNQWVRDLDLAQIRKDLNDPQVDMVFSQIAQESVLVETVKTIFRKIAEFISWVLRKLKELWMYFFGKVQRGIRALRAANDKITKHDNSNGFFNEGAFNAAPVPANLIGALGLGELIHMGFSPDEFYTTFSEVLDMWTSNPQSLYEEVFVKFNASPITHKWQSLVALIPAHVGGKPITAIEHIKATYPAKRTMRESAYDKESVLLLLKEAMDAIVGYEKNTNLISTKGGNVSALAAKRILDYQERTDVTEHEAIQMAKDVQLLGNWLQLVLKNYQLSFEFILWQMNMVAAVYQKYMK